MRKYSEKTLRAIVRQCPHCCRIHYGAHACNRAPVEAPRRPVYRLPALPETPTGPNRVELPRDNDDRARPAPTAGERDALELAAELRALYPNHAHNITDDSVARLVRSIRAIQIRKRGGR